MKEPFLFDINMRRSVLLLLFSMGVKLLCAQQHPVVFGKSADFNCVAAHLKNDVLLRNSYTKIKEEVDATIGKNIDVPFPKDPAGGYTHDQHKYLYNLMFNAGCLYQITQDKKYAELVKQLLLKYTLLNPTLKNHPQSTGNYPGRLFWQSLNDANWLVYAGTAFDCIHDYLTPSERKMIANGAFKPLVDYFTRDLNKWFDLIHNHAVWAAAGVGIVGLATDNVDYVQMALYGSKKDSTAGFIAQLNGLFSPDGFYHEGPYYTRYAILPFYLFAQALENSRPQLGIFKYRNSVLKKALDVALQQTNTDGIFFSYNDALKDKSYVSNEVVVALDIAAYQYGISDNYLAVAKLQNKVILNKSGWLVANQLNRNKSVPLFNYHAADYTDGPNGEQGGLSVLRFGKSNNLTSLVFKYTGHGLSHGHFDKLGIQLFDKGNEILQDYGAVRYINIEQKWGGRYLKETNSYAQQTIAHNTLTVDEASHYEGSEKLSEAHHSIKLFSDISGPYVQASAALDSQAYPGVVMQRSEYLLVLPETGKKIILDLFKVKSEKEHQYDLPFNYVGTLMQTNFKYHTFNDQLTTLGLKNGYQHLWKLAQADSVSPFTQFTFLNKSTFYTISSLNDVSPMVFLTQTGANDPDFNLRKESSYILRTRAKNQTAINCIEIHGSFSPVTEIASHSYPDLKSISKKIDNDAYTAVAIDLNGKMLELIQCNSDFRRDQMHELQIEGHSYKWKGPFLISYNQKSIHSSK